MSHRNPEHSAYHFECFLIAKTLVHGLREGRSNGRTVETEAHVVGDAAGHAFRGRTRRNRSLFLERWHAYVYLMYGVHSMLNVTSEVSDVGAKVMLRALEPLDGTHLMQPRRAQAPLIDLSRRSGPLRCRPFVAWRLA